jgi:hypothetical protein
VLLLGTRILKSVSLTGYERERLGFCAFICLLLSLINLFLESFCFLLVRKGESHRTALDLEGMEEGPVLVVGEGVEYLLIPYDTTVRLANIDQFNPEGVAYEVVGQHGSALQPGVGPFGRIWVCDVQASDGDG